MKPYYDIKPVIFYNYILKKDFSGVIETDDIMCFINPKTDKDMEQYEYSLNIGKVGKYEEYNYTTFRKNNKYYYDSDKLLKIINKLNKDNNDIAILRYKKEHNFIHLYTDLKNLYYEKDISSDYPKQNGAFWIELYELDIIKNYIENYKYHQDEFKLYRTKNIPHNYTTVKVIEKAIIMKNTNVKDIHVYIDGHFYFYSNSEKKELEKLFKDNNGSIDFEVKQTDKKYFNFIEIEYNNLIDKYVYKKLDNNKCLVLNSDIININVIIKKSKEWIKVD